MPNPPIVSRDTPVDFPIFKKGVCSISVDLLFAKGKGEILERIFKFHGVTLQLATTASHPCEIVEKSEKM